jgi:quercetin dioxygenase-like cupin family protein
VAPLTFRSPEDTQSFVTGDVIPDTLADKFGEGDLRLQVRAYHPGGPDALQLMEITVAPNDGPNAHAHEEDEIMFVLEGELHFGAHVVTAGSSVHIPRRTLYSFRAGPDGCRFVNVRARADDSYITKDELRTQRDDGSSSR